jgi:hypothetical protein
MQVAEKITNKEKENKMNVIDVMGIIFIATFCAMLLIVAI